MTTPSNTEPAEITPAAQWRSAVLDGFPITLPSGKTARLRRTLDMIKLIKAGRIPNPLAGVINEMIQTRNGQFDLAQMPEEALPQLLEMVDDMIPRIFVQPKVVVPPDDAGLDWAPEDPEAISLLHVEFADRMFAFSFAQGGPASLASFREQQVAAMAGRTDGREVALPTEPASGDQ